MNALQEAHSNNKATLEAIKSDVPVPAATPAVNPLLQRNKLKSSRKPNNSKSKKAAAAKQVAQVKASELSVVSAAGDESVAGGKEAEVLDLADQLLEQLQTSSRDESATGPEEGDSRGSESLLGQEDNGREKGEGASGGFREKLGELTNGLIGSSSGGDKEKKVSRQQARKLRKANHFDMVRSNAQAEVEAENDQSVADEQNAIRAGCEKLGVKVKEIDPDGHCLYSAIADQANILGLSLTQRKETYASTRYYAAAYMRSHPDEFLPFLTSEDVAGDGMMSPAEYAKYCDTVEKTAEWGGQHEINALSKYFGSPIWVLQAGTDLVKVGEDLPPGRGPIFISYHRKEYGLGEHYNSLRR